MVVNRQKMKTIILSFFLISLVATCSAGVGGRSGGNSGSRGSSGGQKQGNYPYALAGLGNEQYYSRTNGSPKAKSSFMPRSGRNISTLQIVFILSLIMSLGFLGYYFIQFYPFICSKESKYDHMGRSSVTPTHSREFEYESTSSATKSTNASIQYDV